MARKFKEGDTVRLISGGPLMTVKGYKMLTDFLSDGDETSFSETEVEVTWFEKNDLKNATFGENQIKLSDNKVRISTVPMFGNNNHSRNHY